MEGQLWRQEEKHCGEEYTDEYGKYFGKMEGGKPSGIGSELCVEGAKYEGEWKKEMQFGKGIMHFPDGPGMKGPTNMDSNRVLRERGKVRRGMEEWEEIGKGL